MSVATWSVPPCREQPAEAFDVGGATPFDDCDDGPSATGRGSRSGCRSSDAGGKRSANRRASPCTSRTFVSPIDSIARDGRGDAGRVDVGTDHVGRRARRLQRSSTNRRSRFRRRTRVAPYDRTRRRRPAAGPSTSRHRVGRRRSKSAARAGVSCRRRGLNVGIRCSRSALVTASPELVHEVSAGGDRRVPGGASPGATQPGQALDHRVPVRVVEERDRLPLAACGRRPGGTTTRCTVLRQRSFVHRSSASPTLTT